MFEHAELAVFKCGDFEIISIDKACIVLFHKHAPNDKYHVHFVYEESNALLAYIEIRQHDNIAKRDKKRKLITTKTNMPLLQAANCI